MKVITTSARNVMVMALSKLSTSRRCNSCRGTGGVYIDEDLQLQFEVCLKCDGYGFIYGDDDEG